MPAVLYEKRGHLAYITLNRPEAMNALNRDVRQGLTESFHQFAADNDAWVAIVSGAGGRAFSAGADLKEMSAGRQAESGENWQDPFWGPEAPGLGRWPKVWKPIIAAINGFCLAGGLELALSCDIRVASEDSRFALTEVMRGIIPGGGGTQRLPRVIPLPLALEWMFTGEHYPASEAYRIGLINHVVPADHVMAKAEEVAGKICANAPLSLRAIKESAYRGLDTSLDEGLRIEALFSKAIRTTEDSKEGPRAFAEKRPAQFKGR